MLLLYSFTKELSKQLERSEIKTVKAYQVVSLVSEQLNNLRSNQVDEFEAIFKKCKAVAVLSNVELANPRTLQCQAMQFNVDRVSPEKYYRRSTLRFTVGNTALSPLSLVYKIVLKE